MVFLHFGQQKGTLQPQMVDWGEGGTLRKGR